MQAEPRSRALRAMVADLAALGDEDLKAVLNDLDAPSRDRLLDWIAAFRRGDDRRVEAADGAPEFSPWLLQRLSDGTSNLAPHALETLRTAAAAEGWTLKGPAPRDPGRAGFLLRLGLGR